MDESNDSRNDPNREEDQEMNEEESGMRDAGGESNPNEGEEMDDGEIDYEEGQRGAEGEDEEGNEEDNDLLGNPRDPNEAENDGEEELDDIDIENGDFPDFATDFNKELNQKIVAKKKMNKRVQEQIADVAQRLQIMKDHKKNVESELKQTRLFIDEKTKQTDTEQHLKQVAERQIGRMNMEFEKLSREYSEVQDRINEMQNFIYKGNEKLDQVSLEKNWNKEELQQWRLASQQKEKDNQTIEKYRRADEIKIKELNLLMERLTVEVSRIQRELETEMTETQAYQIELDKTAEEFRRHHEERQRLCAQWDEAIQNIARRDQLTWEEGQKMAQIKLQITEKESDLQELYKDLEKEKGNNKASKEDVDRFERRIIAKKNENEQRKLEYQNEKAKIKIYQNRLSAFATEMGTKNSRIATLKQEVLNKKQRLDNEQKKYKAQEVMLEKEWSIDGDLKMTQEEAEAQYKQRIQYKNEMDHKIRLKKEELFKASQTLFKYKQQEANMYSDIQGTIAAIRNLQAHMSKLNQEYQRQQELLYNAEYQIQLMERNVNKAKGERTVQESNQIEKETEAAEQECSKLRIEHHNLTKALKQLEEEQRNLDKRFSQVKEDKQKYKTLIEKLNLENDMTLMDLNKISKVKDDHMVQHDLMKLEIQKIRDTLIIASDEVLDLENKKNQIELSMQEREREISVHHDVLLAEYKAAEAERYTIAKELNEQKTKVRNLQIRYEALIQVN